MSGRLTIIEGKPSRFGDWTFKLEQDGLDLVNGFGSREDAVRREAVHYGHQYAQDGDCTVTIRPPRGYRP